MIRPVLPINPSFRFGLQHSGETAYIVGTFFFIHKVMNIDGRIVTRLNFFREILLYQVPDK